MKAFTVSKNDAGQRLDKFISKASPLLPQALLYKYIRLKRIKVNGKRSEISYRLSEGDVVEMYINDEFFAENAGKNDFLHAKNELSVVYEDENILLVNKPAGLIAHEDDSERFDTLINRIKLYLFGKGEYIPEKENSFAPALCNRIDRNTSGIVIAAKNHEALRILNEKIKVRELKKLYLCVVLGVPEKKSGTLSGFLLKDADKNTVTVYHSPVPGALSAVTGYRVLETKNGYSLVEAELLTGRTHQIRAQFADAGHPLLGDTKYGKVRDFEGTGFFRQALCSYKLTFDFKTDAGSLEYLRGKTFEISDIPFLEAFRRGL